MPQHDFKYTVTRRGHTVLWYTLILPIDSSDWCRLTSTNAVACCQFIYETSRSPRFSEHRKYMKYTHHQQPGRFLCLPETRKFRHWLLQLLAIITTEHMIEVKSVPDGKVLQPWKPNLQPKNDASLKEAPSWSFKILGSILALEGFLAISETNSEDLSSNIRWEFHQSIAFVKIQPLFLLGSRSRLHQFWRCQVICVIWEAM